MYDTQSLYEGIKWIWFDLDDTLYDFSGSSLIALTRLYELYDLGAYFDSCERWIQDYHAVNHRLWDAYGRNEIDQKTLRHDRFYLPLTGAGMDLAEAERLTLLFDTLYLALLAQTGKTIPGAHRLLSALRAAGFKIGILSNGFKSVQPAKLKSSRLDTLIDCMILSDDIGINKPDRRLFDYAASTVGVDASQCLMIGDNMSTDIAGADNAGWHSHLFDPANDSLSDLMPLQI